MKINFGRMVREGLLEFWRMRSQPWEQHSGKGEQPVQRPWGWTVPDVCKEQWGGWHRWTGVSKGGGEQMEEVRAGRWWGVGSGVPCGLQGRLVFLPQVRYCLFPPLESTPKGQEFFSPFCFFLCPSPRNSLAHRLMAWMVWCPEHTLYHILQLFSLPAHKNSQK